jgi:hypothetical protein
MRPRAGVRGSSTSIGSDTSTLYPLFSVFMVAMPLRTC